MSVIEVVKVKRGVCPVRTRGAGHSTRNSVIRLKSHTATYVPETGIVIVPEEVTHRVSGNVLEEKVINLISVTDSQRRTLGPSTYIKR